MSKIFVQSKNEQIKEIFNKKQLFKIVTQSEHRNLIDFSYGEKRLYGRVDRHFQPVIPNQDFFQLTGIGGPSVNDMRVFNFVADAFRELQIKFKTKAAQGEIDPNDNFLTNLRPTAAYRDPALLYNKNSEALSAAIANIIIKKHLQFTNFNEFANVIMPYVENLIKSKTVTFPAFVKSKDCPMAISGLVIEIGTINPNNDKFKYDKYYQSKNWEFFLNACNAYGFMVDCNMPNRIIADLNSSYMLEKMQKYNSSINSADMCMANCYTPAGLNYYNSFKNLLFRLYSDNRKRKVLTITHNSHDGGREIIRQIKNYKYEDFQAEVGDRKIMELYFKIRFLEEESVFSAYEKKVIERDLYEVFKVSPNEALSIFEKILNKTFDYQGSLSYIRMREKKLGR